MLMVLYFNPVQNAYCKQKLQKYCKIARESVEISEHLVQNLTKIFLRFSRISKHVLPRYSQLILPPVDVNRRNSSIVTIIITWIRGTNLKLRGYSGPFEIIVVTLTDNRLSSALKARNTGLDRCLNDQFKYLIWVWVILVLVFVCVP